MTHSAFLFDIDGTLLKLPHVGRIAFGRAFRDAYGIDYPNIPGLTFVGATDTAVVREMAHDCRLVSTPAKEEYFFGRLARYLDDAMDATPPIVLPGVPALLAALAARGDALGLVTGNVRPTAWCKVRHARLDAYFTFGGYGDDHPLRTEIARVAMSRRPEGTTPIALIGDTPRDIEAARANGLRAVAVATGWITYEELAAAKPDVLLRDFTDLPQALKVFAEG